MILVNSLTIDWIELNNTDLNYTIVRPSYIVGYGNHIARLEYFVDKLFNSKSVKVNGENCPINLVDVNDVAECLKHIILSTNNLRGKIYENLQTIYSVILNSYFN